MLRLIAQAHAQLRAVSWSAANLNWTSSIVTVRPPITWKSEFHEVAASHVIRLCAAGVARLLVGYPDDLTNSAGFFPRLHEDPIAVVEAHHGPNRSHAA